MFATQILAIQFVIISNIIWTRNQIDTYPPHLMLPEVSANSWAINWHRVTSFDHLILDIVIIFFKIVIISAYIIK